MDRVSSVERPRRREYSGQFKEAVLAQCRQPGASVAGVALGHGINPNMVHRWMREERQRQVLAALGHGAAPFVALPLNEACTDQVAVVVTQPSRAQSCEREGVANGVPIVIERAGLRVTLQWPQADASGCAQMLRELLR